MHGFEPNGLLILNGAAAMLRTELAHEVWGMERIRNCRHKKSDSRSLFCAFDQPKPLVCEFGAGNETRTRDPDLGKVVLYQLSYSRVIYNKKWRPLGDSNPCYRRERAVS